MQAYRQTREIQRLGWLSTSAAHAFAGHLEAERDRARGKVTEFSLKGLGKAASPSVSWRGHTDKRPLPSFEKTRFEHSRFFGLSECRSGGRRIHSGRVCADCRLLYRQRHNARRSHSRQSEGRSAGRWTSDTDRGDLDVTMIDADAVPVSPSRTPTFGPPSNWIGFSRVAQPVAAIRRMRPIDGLPAHLYSGHLVDPDEQDEVHWYDHLVVSTSKEEAETREVWVPRLLTDSDSLQQPFGTDEMDLDSPYKITDSASSTEGGDIGFIL